MKQMTSKFVLAALVAVMTLTVAVPAQAREKKQAIALNIEPSIQFVGAEYGASTFRVQFNSDKAIKFELTIRNEEGIVIYTQEFESANFSKYIKFTHEAGEDVKVSFNIRDIATGAEQTYNVDSTVTTVKTVNVTKL